MRLNLIFSLVSFCIIASSFGVFVHAAEDSHPHEAALKNPDGTWKWTNALIRETSPYLLLHAHNPVDWYPWGPEALERAKDENKPIFLSVGYSTCYWCHVMERKVFSDPEIAKMMNAWFINIKVDREERPDIDEIYMTATQIMTGSGGWPNSVFLTPDLLPFFGGTYFPPEDSRGRPGFPKILNALREVWLTQQTEVMVQAEKITEVIRQATAAAPASVEETPLDRQLISAAVKALESRYDTTYGGFSSAPKFPSPTNLELLLGEHEREPSKSVIEMVTNTLETMAYGGMYDQIGGGFHRYSVDAKWLVPHFEKMLYDNALLAKVYLHTYQLTKNPLYRRVAEEIFEFVSREMTSGEGGFYSALDAEVDAEEGKSYIWTKGQIQKVLGRKDAKLFMQVYGVDKGPNFEGGTNILYLPVPLSSAAKSLKRSEDELHSQLEPLKAKLLSAREERKQPLLDTKVIASWNGLMIDAFAYGYEVLGDKRYRDVAEKAARFNLKYLRTVEGRLMRTYRDGVAKYNGYLDDYAFLVRGLLGLYQATDEETWLTEAASLTDRMNSLFWDDKNGGFYFTLANQKHLVVRTKNPYDSALPSGNAVAANNLLTLAQHLDKKEYLDKAEKTLQNFAGMMKQSPGAFMHMLFATNRYLSMDWTKVGEAHQERSSQLSLNREVPGEINIFGLPTAPQPSEDELLTLAASIPSKGDILLGNPFDVEVQLELAEGWHINANPASWDLLIPTTVSVSPDASVEILSVTYPKGTPLHADWKDAPISVYEGDVTVKMQLKLKQGETIENAFPLKIDVRYQACDADRCTPPSTATIPLWADIYEKSQN